MQIDPALPSPEILPFHLHGGTYLLIHFLGNFREKTKKVPTHSLFRKLSEISPKFPKKLEALLLVKQLGTGNFYRF